MALADFNRLGQPLDPGWVFDDWVFVGCFEGEGKLLAEHIQRAVELARLQDAALIFTGGKVRRSIVGDLSEAEADRNFATAKASLRSDKTAVYLETFARDSLENVDFSLALAMSVVHSEAKFREIKLTFTGWEFKRERFQLHAAALRLWLMAKGIVLRPDWLDYVGVNNPPTIPSGENELLRRLKDDLLLLAEDPKRKRRDNFDGSQRIYPAIGRELPDLDALSALQLRAL
jgi:hypothetical protein